MDVLPEERRARDGGPDGAQPGDHDAAASRPDIDDACSFLSAQASWLELGLRTCEDTPLVASALQAHERGHETWLALIGAAERAGEGPVADRLAALYQFHGRLVGVLEGGPDGRVDAVTCAEVRRLLGERLVLLTDQTIAALRTSVPRAPAVAALP